MPELSPGNPASEESCDPALVARYDELVPVLELQQELLHPQQLLFYPQECDQQRFESAQIHQVYGQPCFQ